MADNRHAKSMRREVLADRASSIAQDFQDVGTAAKRVAVDSVDALRETANELLDEGRAKAREVGDTVHTKVQEQPVKSVLIAAGVGFLLGLFWVRR